MIAGNIYKTREKARREIFSFIEILYNRKRIHQSLGYKTPEMFEGSVAQFY